MIDPNLLEIAAIVTEQGKALNCDMKLITSINFKEWGQNEILVSPADGIRSLDQFPEKDKWLSVASQLIGSEVMTTSEQPLGVLEDVAIEENGRVAGYEVNDFVPLNGDKVKRSYISSNATHTLESGRLIINTKDLIWFI